MYEFQDHPSPKFVFALARESTFRPCLKGRAGFARALAVCVGVVALFAFGAAGPYDQKIPPHANIHSVAIIAAIGETFMFERVRNSPFEWMGPPETSFLEIANWGLDDLVTRKATAALSGRYTVEPVKYEEADFDTWTWPSLVRHIRELPLPEDNIDAYVVVLRDWRGDGIGRSVHQVAGVGAYRHDYSAGPKLGVFASYRIVVIDAHSYDILTSRAALTTDGSLPWTPLAPSLWPKTQNDLTEKQTTSLRNEIMALIDKTLEQTVQEMGLAGPQSRAAAN
jgi:hypothetical protein